MVSVNRLQITVVERRGGDVPEWQVGRKDLRAVAWDGFGEADTDPGLEVGCNRTRHSCYMSTRLSEIRQLIDRADNAYYNTGQAIMSDDAYNALKTELLFLCPDDERLARVGAPVGAGVADGEMLVSRTHAIPMGSQNKADTREEFDAWVAGLSLGPNPVFHANFKSDGCSVSLTFSFGYLTLAVTRGNGLAGEDITANARHFGGIPRCLVRTPAGEPFSGHIRAEIILPTRTWKEIDPEWNDPVAPSNPRNTGNGIARRKNGLHADALTVQAFRAYGEDGIEVCDTEEHMQEFLRELGFTTTPEITGTAQEIWDFFELIKGKRDVLPFWIDGLVVKVNHLDTQKGLGVVNDRPKGQVALKFPAEGVETVLREVVLTVGHSGAVTPTGKMDPVPLGGVIVTSALLCNMDEIRALDVALGDTVFVERRGDVIPKVVRVVHRPENRQTIPEPTACPLCFSGLSRRLNVDGEESAALFCVNESCDSKIYGKISCWVSSLNILGIGDEVLDALITQMGIADAADLYRLHARQTELANLTTGGVRFGEKRAAKLIEQIEAKRNLTLEEFIGSLGVDGLAQRRVELIRQQSAGKMDTLKAWTDGTLLGIAEEAGVPKIAVRIVQSLVKRKALIDKLLAVSVTVKESAAAPSPRGGVPSVCITGALSKPKSYYQDLIKAKGWEWKDGVSKTLTYLVMADANSTSDKAKKARQLGTTILDEAGLLDLLR